MANDIELPKMPEARFKGPASTGTYFDAFTEGQMQDYARAAVLADRETRAALPAQAVALSAQILQSVCESDPADPDDSETICIHALDLVAILDAHLLAAPVRDVAPSDADIDELASDFDECKTMRDIRGFARALLSRYRAAPLAAAPAAPQAVPDGQSLADVWELNATEFEEYGQADRAAAFRECAAEIRRRAAQPAAQPADAQDAARYRLVRLGRHWSVIDGAGSELRGEVLDAAVDAARTQGGSNG